MGIHWIDGGYSAAIEMFLLVDGDRYDIAKLGPSLLTLRDPALVRNGHGQIVIRVDDHEEIQDVILHQRDPAVAELEYA